MDPTKLVDTSILAGWIRAGVASGLSLLVTNVGLADVFTPATNNVIGAAVSMIVVGAWSHYAKKVS